MENSKRRDDHFYNMIKKCQEGNRNAQNELFNKFAPMMMPICRGICKTKEDAEDALMESFANVFKHIHEFYGENGAEIYQWIKRIVKNQCISNMLALARKTAPRPTEAENSIDITASLKPSASMDLDVVYDTIGTQLPKRMAKALKSYTIDGLTYSETAKLMNTTERNVRVLVCRARDRLVQIMPEYKEYR